MSAPWEQALGALPRPDATTLFRVWAPHARSVQVRTAGGDLALAPVGFDVHEGTAPVGAGADYRFVQRPHEGRSEQVLPNPSSRDQPEGLRGPSRVLDPAAFRWSAEQCSTPALETLVLYELHVGTFTRDGACAVELMAAADFPGQRGTRAGGEILCTSPPSRLCSRSRKAATWCSRRTQEPMLAKKRPRCCCRC